MKFKKKPSIVDVPEVCEWKLEIYNGYDGDHDADRTTACGTYYNAYDIDDYLGGIEKVKYCPNCGKRIKYVEMEE